MNFCGIDIETTGLEPGDHKTIEVYIGIWNEFGVLIKELNQRINPGRGIAADAQRVHGISINDLIGKPSFLQVAPSIIEILNDADYYIWHNGDEFDGPFLKRELKDNGLAMPERPAIDTMQHGVWATFDGKKPNLGELCFACNIPYDKSKAHAADYDVHRMMDCFFVGMKLGFYHLP